MSIGLTTQCLILLFALCSVLCSPAYAQVKNKLPRVGVRIGGLIGSTGLDNQRAGYLGRVFVTHSLFRNVEGEFDAGYGEIGGKLYRTQLIPLEYRFLFVPQSMNNFWPHAYVGLGATNYNVQYRPPNATPDTKRAGWAPHFPFGIGARTMVDEVAALEFNAGYNFTFVDGLDAVKSGKNDGYWMFEVGISIVGERDQDPDKDSLLTSEEKAICTDPLNPDTDGDGLNDGAEVHHYHTNPCNRDTDGDGLSDGDEVLKYHTDPLNPDTDGDRLKDGDEVLIYHTDPLKVDTDGDGLTDGDEVLLYKTNPLVVDTDGGTVGDGIEVRRGTNPLDPSDDVPKPLKEELKIELNKPIVLVGVVFKFNSAEISPQSGAILEKAFNTLNQHPEIGVEIHGHTDNVGTASVNLRLSLARAESVKMYLVRKGIAANRIGTRGFGSVRPITTNKTSKGRQQNRRIEFVRVK